MDELVGEFVSETRETLQSVSEALVGWEHHPDDAARLDEIFRFVHTVKGSCGFLDLPRIGGLAHAAETALAEVRDGRRVVGPALVDWILALVDRIAVLTEALETGGAIPDIESDAFLIDQIDSNAGAVTGAEPVLAKARNVRISVDLLEGAMVQVSDLVLARNELGRRLREIDGDTATIAAFDRMSHAISDVRETIARTRMQPIDRLFSMLSRVVRDTGVAVGKTVSLSIDGADVEIDREMIEAIRDPLLHIVRNAIDHGIEHPEDRAKAGKPANGRLLVAAQQSGNQVSITVSDDGRGIDTARLLQKAIAAELVTPTKAATMSPEAIAALIFAPGLSTAGTITDISGRGVGMDIVRANIERLGGAITLDNRIGQGLAITLRAPLTLSIMNALLVEAGGQNFAVPRAAIRELISMTSDAIRVEALGGGQVAVVRGQILPVVSLAAVLGLQAVRPQHLAIVEMAGVRRFALSLDRVSDYEEVVVRPAAPQLAAIGTFAGQTLPDNGVPMLVIDVAGIAKCATIESQDHAFETDAEIASAVKSEGSLLIFDGLDGVRRAIRRSQIAHVDEISVHDFVGKDGAMFVRFEGTLLPAIVDGALLGEGAEPRVLIRVNDGDGVIGYPVAAVDDLVPIAHVTPAPDGIIEGYVMVEGMPVALLAWPRKDRGRTSRRKIA